MEHAPLSIFKLLGISIGKFRSLIILYQPQIFLDLQIQETYSLLFLRVSFSLPVLLYFSLDLL